MLALAGLSKYRHELAFGTYEFSVRVCYIQTTIGMAGVSANESYG